MRGWGARENELLTSNSRSMTMRTTDLDAMSDEQLKELFSGSGCKKYFDAILEATAAEVELSSGELRLMTVMDDEVDEFYRWDWERKTKHFNDYLQFITERKDNLLLLTWIFDHADEMYRWLDRLEKATQQRAAGCEAAS
jgi:tRNA isopentenyl-2-thiomethyl-A-37 hydroxylase MiaE